MRRASRCRHLPEAAVAALRDPLLRLRRSRVRGGNLLCRAARSERSRRELALPLVAETVELSVLVEALCDARVTSYPRAQCGNDDLSLADRPHGDLVAGMEAGGTHRLDRDRDLVLRGDLRHAFTLAH